MFLCGVNYGGDAKEVKKMMKKYEKHSSKVKRIMVVHAMIGNKPIYPGQDITKAKTFLKNNPLADVILCGDYHYPFNL